MKQLIKIKKFTITCGTQEVFIQHSKVALSKLSLDYYMKNMLLDIGIETFYPIISYHIYQY